MSLIYFQGWDIYTSTLDINYDVRTDDAWPFQGAVDVDLIVSASSYLGRGRSLRVNDDGWVWQKLEAEIDEGTSVTVGFAIRADVNQQTWMSFNDGTLGAANVPGVAFYGETDGSMTARISAFGTIIFDTSVPIVNGEFGDWTYVEVGFQCTVSSQVVGFVDGSAIETSGVYNLASGVGLPWRQIRFGTGGANAQGKHFDDVYITDDKGGAAAPKGRLGGTAGFKIRVEKPTTNGVPTQWVGSSAVSSHVLLSDGDTGDYIIASAIGLYEMWQVDTSGIGGGDIIHAVQTHIFADKVNAGSAVIQQVISAVGSTNVIGSSHYVSPSWGYFNEIWDTKNGVTKWNTSALTNGEFGVRTLI